MPEQESSSEVVYGKVPDWVDGEFFQKALRLGIGDPDLVVTDCEVKEATGKGENYVSIVYAAKVTEEVNDASSDGGDVKRKVHHLIVKCLPSNKARRMMNDKIEFFRKEVDMYGVAFPAFRRLCDDAEDLLPWPLHYYSFLDGDRDYLVMKDLRVTGFVMADRLKGLDTLQLEVALRALGKFHAYSYTLKLKDPETFRSKIYQLFPETLYTLKVDNMIDIFAKNAYSDMAAIVRQWKEPRYETLEVWMEKAKHTIVKDINALLCPDDPGAVLNHGDFWVNNMLFHYPSSGGPPMEVKLIDFQLSRVSSPAGDLSYLLPSSVTESDRRKHWDSLLETAYLSSFWEAMESFGAKDLVEAGLYTPEWLRSEMKRYRPFAMASCLTVTPAALAEASDVPDMDSMTEEELKGDAKSSFASLYNGSHFQERFRGFVDDLLDEGFFD